MGGPGASMKRCFIVQLVERSQETLCAPGSVDVSHPLAYLQPPGLHWREIASSFLAVADGYFMVPSRLLGLVCSAIKVYKSKLLIESRAQLGLDFCLC
mmetsp:Transcript_14355/g.20890  ORF Transcript_14355/g.20890 Transcript_14355/m.20890 type:complete len:98 (-) Transcript_14355:940-1233(-)